MTSRAASTWLGLGLGLGFRLGLRLGLGLGLGGEHLELLRHLLLQVGQPEDVDHHVVEGVVERVASTASPWHLARQTHSSNVSPRSNASTCDPM